LRSYGGLHQRTARTCLKKHEADLLRNYLEVDQLRR